MELNCSSDDEQDQNKACDNSLVNVAATSTARSEECQKINDYCLQHCSETALPTHDYGFKFWNCVKNVTQMMAAKDFKK